MGKLIKVEALMRANNPAIVAAVASYIDDLPAHMRADNDNERSDAGETAILAGALTQATLEAVEADMPEIMFREIAPRKQGIDEGARAFTWEEYDIVGMAKIIANGSDDIPNVERYVKQNEGKIQTYAIAYSYTDQDVREAAFARRNGRQGYVLSPDRAIEAREVVERTKDRDAAYGNATYGIPGFFKGANVALIISPAPAAGTARSWRGVDKTGREVLAELRNGMKVLANTAKGKRRATRIVMGIEMLEAIANMPLNPTGDNQITVLEQFLKSQKEMGRPVTIIGWNLANVADVAGTGDRVVFYEYDSRVLELVEPMVLRAAPPERRGLATHVVNETRFGGIFFKKPLGALYMDFVP